MNTAKLEQKINKILDAFCDWVSFCYTMKEQPQTDQRMYQERALREIVKLIKNYDKNKDT